jgi:hypothetical protein
VGRPSRQLYQAPAIDPDTNQPAFRRMSFGGAEGQPRPSLWGPPSAPGGNRDGKHRLEVEFLNTPPGTRVRTESTGTADRFPVLSVGYARMGIA